MTMNEAWRSRPSDHFDAERQQFFNPEADTDRGPDRAEGTSAVLLRADVRTVRKCRRDVAGHEAAEHSRREQPDDVAREAQQQV